MSIEDLIDNVAAKNNVEGKKTFDTVMGQKLTAALDAKKIEIASTIHSDEGSESEAEG